MEIFVLIVVCIYTLLGIVLAVLLFSGDESFESEPHFYSLAIGMIITGILAIIFQSINL